MFLILVVPRFLDNPPGDKQTQLNIGSSPKLRCRVQSNSRASIDWTKNGRDIDYAREGVVKEGYALKFISVQPKDEGRYTCKVYNGYGAINFTYIVTVTG